MRKLTKNIRMILREKMADSPIQRIPEPNDIMEEKEQVGTFDDQGKDNGPLIPVYHFNALAVSSLVPPGGTYLDLGSGTGRFAMHLAAVRPDIQIIGLDLSPTMIGRGRTIIKNFGLEKQISLRLGDMTDFVHSISEPIHAVGSLYSLHHLPHIDDLLACLRQIKALHKKWNCGIWLYDFARPSFTQTAYDFPTIYSSDASTQFKQDTANSIQAAYSFRELQESWKTCGLPQANQSRSRLLKIFQYHMLPNNALFPETLPPIANPKFRDIQSTKEFFFLRFIFPSIQLEMKTKSAPTQKGRKKLLVKNNQR